MKVKEDQISWDEPVNSPEELDLLLTKLRQKQRPDVFSEVGMAIGWRRQQVPATLSVKVMKEIREECRGRLFNAKIFWSASILSTLMLLAVIGLLAKLGEPSGLREAVRTEVGLFWLVASIGVSLFALTTSFFMGEYLLEKRLG